MIGSALSKNFPAQKKTTAQKNKKWQKECIDAAVSMSLYNSNEKVRDSRANMKANYLLYDGVLDSNDIERTVNPWGLSGSTFPEDMYCYPIGTNKINLLVGEEAKRRFDWRIRVTNDDAVSEKEKYIKQVVLQRLTEASMSENMTEEQAQKVAQEVDRWKNYEAQDIRERLATQILTHLWQEQKLKLVFNQGFKDALLSGEEIYCADIIGGKPILRRVNPLNLRTVGISGSNYIEDADIIIEEGYYSVGWVIDNYYEYLTPKEIDFLEKGYGTNNGGNLLIDYPGANQPFLKIADVDGFIDIPDGDFSNAPYDSQGNIRVSRVVWKSRRKIGILSYFDETTGEPMSMLVDENYKANVDTGETVEGLWINEWWEGTKIGNEFYKKVQPRPIQFRRMDNLSLCGSGYVGTVYNTNGGKANSLMNRMKPYIHMYNKLAYRTDKAIAKYKGPMIELDLAKKPGQWSVDKWMYYGEEMGYLVVDSFNEGVKGQAQGKLAGNFNTTGKVYNPDMGNYISQNIEMMRFIEDSLGNSVGITRQREGAIDNRETVGGVERSVTQSSHATEELFLFHDFTKLRALEVLLETAKYAYLNDSQAFQYISDSDLAQQIFTLDGQLFNEADYGLVMTDSSTQTELRNALIQLAHAGIQNQVLNFSTFMDIYMSSSIADTRRKIEASEIQMQERQQQQAEAQQQHEQQMLQMEIENREDLQLHEIESQLVERETKLMLEELKLMAKDNEPQVIEDNSQELDLQERLKEKEIKSKERIADKDRESKERIAKLQEETKERIAKLRPKPTTSTKTKKK